MESSFVIISDSSCDLSKELRDRFAVADYVPGHVFFPDGSDRLADLDWKDISPEEFFKMVGDKKLNPMTTSTPSIPEITDIMEKYLSKGKDILAIVLSTGISGTYGVFVNAKKELETKYPDRKIIVIDSLRYSTSLALLCVYAAGLRNMGKSIDEVAQWVEENKECIHQIGWMDDLYFCKRMGRVSGTAAVMGTLVGVKAMADFNHEGKSQVIGKTRGYKNAYNACIDYMKATIINPETQIVFIAETLRKKEAEELRALIEAEIKPREIIMTTVGQSCGPSIGPGLVAAFYFGKKISENLEREQKILAEIVKK
ncbi:MAG: DegV family protein [Ruminococcus sp.]